MFTYDNGEEIRQGDDVLVCNTKNATVDKVIEPETIDAKNYGCYNTGGILLRISDECFELWTKIDEPLDLKRRYKDKR